MRLLLSRLILIAWLLGMPAAFAQAVLEPPFGLHWGDSPEKLIDWASKHSLDTDISVPGDQPALRVVKISSRKPTLPGTTAKAIEGRFLAGRLFEVTVHYGDDGNGIDAVEDRFNKMKRELTSEYGDLTADRQDRSLLPDQFSTRTQSFHREPVQGLMLLLAYSEIEDLLRKKREATFSLLYRNDNLRQDLERKLQEPVPGATGK